MIDVEQVLGGLEEISDQLDVIERGMDEQELVLGHDALEAIRMLETDKIDSPNCSYEPRFYDAWDMPLIHVQGTFQGSAKSAHAERSRWHHATD